MAVQSGFSQEDLRKRQMQADVLLQGATAMPDKIGSPLEGFSHLAQAALAARKKQLADNAVHNSNLSPSQYPTAPGGLFGLGALFGGGSKGLY